MANIPNNPQIEVIKTSQTGLFTNYIFKAIPLAFDESLSYYETLCGLLSYLKDTVIPTVNNNADAVSELQTLYVELKNYVDNYFTNLDVQTEINKKLDEMVKDGTLTNLIEKYIDPYLAKFQKTLDEQTKTLNDSIESQNNKIDTSINLQNTKINTTLNAQNENINAINTKVNSAVSSNPIAVNSKDLMIDTSKIYVLTTDGYWYYYNGTAWIQGGLYQSTVNSNDVEYLRKKDNSLNYNKNIRYDITMKDGYRLSQSAGIEYAENGFSCTPDFIPYDGAYKIRYFGIKDGTTTQEITCYYDENYNFISYTNHNGVKDQINLEKIPDNTKYIKFCALNEHIESEVYITEELLSNRRINIINNFVNELDLVNVFNKNIKTNYEIGEVVSLVPETANGYKYIIIDCEENNIYMINGHGGNNPRLWAFIDENNKLLMKSISELNDTVIITAPDKANKLICNFQTTTKYSIYLFNQLSLNNLNIRLENIEDKFEINSYKSSFSSPENYGSCYVRSIKSSHDLANYLTDFKKPDDLMCHVGTFKIINNIVYVTYYASKTSTIEDPTKQLVRFAYASLDNLENKTYHDILNVGDTFDNKTVTAIYDTILSTIDNDNLYIMWTCALDDVYTRLYKIYNITNNSFGDINYNYFKVNNNTNIFNSSNMKSILDSNNISHKPITGDIGIMQKLTSHVEGENTYYYTGCYAEEFNCIIKSTDLITWEYVSTPTFKDNSQYENPCYIIDDKLYYFIRQKWKYNYGLLSVYDLSSNTWSDPIKINDCQSRSDFFQDIYGNLYLVHANDNRNHITITRIDTDYLVFNTDRIDAYLIQSFYPYVDLVNGNLYMIYTQARSHMYFVKFDLGINDEYILESLYNKLYS